MKHNSDIQMIGIPSTGGIANAMLGACAFDVAVLFAREDSIYKMLGADCWDISRDARNYPGNKPVIAHPPCRAWGQLSHMAKPRPDEKKLALFAIEMVRKYGGVLEHPRASKLFPAYLPLPGLKDEYGGYSICVDQFWWGHKCKKNTLLYIVGCAEKDLPPIPLRFDAVTHIIGTSGRRKNGTRYTGKKEVTKQEREATPVAMAEWLLSTALRCRTQHCA